MAYIKPYLPVPDQLALMKSRGMVISDDALAQSYLNKIGYYRLSGYWFPYRQSIKSVHGTTVLDDFRENSKFSEIVELYVFDKKLRLLLMDAIERIEIALRVQITLELGKRGPNAHRDRGALHPNFISRAIRGSTETYHQKWLRLHDDAYIRSKEEFAKHFKTKYPTEDPPIWIAAELWDFGAMSMLYSGLKKGDQTTIANFFSIPSFGIMESWLRSINVTRNICAHHSRLWNKASVVQPAWPTKEDCPDLGHIHGNTQAQTRVYGIACVCAYLLRSINPNSLWKERFKILIKAFPTSKIITLAAAGFPDDWEKSNLWS
jgi:abortive infection bacteriophage resistance protein